MSSSCFVFPTATPAHDPTVIASPKGQVTAHTGGKEGQGDKGQPPEAKLVITGIARARVCIVSFWVRHTVIEHAVRTPHTADLADATLYSVRSILALTPPVLLVVEHVPAVDAPRPLPILLSPPRFAPGRLSLNHSALDVFAQIEVRVAHVRVIVIVFGGLGFGKSHIRVPIVRINVLLPHGGVAVVLITRHPDLFSWVNPHNLLVVVREADVPIGSWDGL